MSQDFAMLGSTFSASLICTNPLYNCPTAHIFSKVRADAGSRDVMAPISLYLKTERLLFEPLWSDMQEAAKTAIERQISIFFIFGSACNIVKRIAMFLQHFIIKPSLRNPLF